MESISEFFSKAKPYLALALRVAAGLVIAYAVPGSFWAVIATQVLHLAVIGTGGPKLSKPVASVLVFFVSLGIAIYQANGAFPGFPAYGGDVATFTSALLVWAEEAVAYAAPVIGAAMLSYNLAFEKLLQVVSDQTRELAFEPEE
jgi:hypothetical protein